MCLLSLIGYLPRGYLRHVHAPDDVSCDEACRAESMYVPLPCHAYPAVYMSCFVFMLPAAFGFS